MIGDFLEIFMLHTSIKPADVLQGLENEFEFDFVPLIPVFGKSAKTMAQLIYLSKKDDKWSTIQKNSGSSFSTAVAEGLILKKKIDSSLWEYSISNITIEYLMKMKHEVHIDQISNEFQRQINALELRLRHIRMAEMEVD